jgi:hypothetical protein
VVAVELSLQWLPENQMLGFEFSRDKELIDLESRVVFVGESMLFGQQVCGVFDPRKFHVLWPHDLAEADRDGWSVIEALIGDSCGMGPVDYRLPPIGSPLPVFLGRVSFELGERWMFALDPAPDLRSSCPFGDERSPENRIYREECL